MYILCLLLDWFATQFSQSRVLTYRCELLYCGSVAASLAHITWYIMSKKIKGEYIVDSLRVSYIVPLHMHTHASGSYKRDFYSLALYFHWETHISKWLSDFLGELLPINSVFHFRDKSPSDEYDSGNKVSFIKLRRKMRIYNNPMAQ